MKRNFWKKLTSMLLAVLLVMSMGAVSLAEEKGFLVTDESGKIDVAKTYAKENAGQGQYVRYCQGLFYLNEAEAIGVDSTAITSSSEILKLFIEPDHKLSTLEVLKLLAYRGEGSDWDANAGKTSSAIGNNRQSECHIFETRQNMPAALATIQWQAMADAEFSIYIPMYSALVTSVHEAYNNNNNKATKTGGKYNYTDEAIADSINWNMQIINNLCYSNRANCADAVKELFTSWQQSLITQQYLVDVEMKALYNIDSAAAKQAANDMAYDLADQLLEMTNVVKAELLEYLAGDQAEPFTTSKANTVPVYSVISDVEVDTYGGPAMHWVNVASTTNGSVKSSPLAASEGFTVTLYPKASEGYVLDAVKVLDKDGNEVAMNGLQFQLPAGGVTVNASFKLAQ